MINKLCDQELLFEVGVEEVRYVTYKYVSSWLVHSQLPLGEKIILEDTIEVLCDDNNPTCTINENTTTLSIPSTSSSSTLDQTNLASSPPSVPNILRKSVYSVESSSKQFEKPKMIYFIPKFWKTPFGELDKRIILMFLIGVLGHVMTYPGIYF